MAVSLAHLSDPHVTTGPLGAAPAEGLHRALARVLALDPRPDAVVITGDLVDRGTPAEYRSLREVIERFPLPLHLAAGNHDDPASLVEEFGGTPFLADGHRAYYAVDHPAYTVIVLSSKLAGSPAGRLGTEQLDWLDTTLARHPRTPAFVCLHHPPVDIGIPFLDGMRLTDDADLAAVLKRHDTVVRVLTGHVHRPITAAYAGTTLTGAPSTYLQSGLALNGDVPNYLPEPTSFLLHVLTDTGCATHTVPISHTAAPLAGF